MGLVVQGTNRAIRGGVHSALQGARQHSNQPTLIVNDGQAPDMRGAHRLLSLFQRIFRPAAQELFRHGIGDGELAQRLSLKKRAHANITIGNDADRLTEATTTTAYGNAAAIVIPHELCCPLEGSLRPARLNLLCHELFDLHD